MIVLVDQLKMVEECKNSQQQRTTAATTFYRTNEKAGRADADFDILSPALLLKDSNDDDNLIESQLLEDDDHLLDNLISEDGGLSTMYHTERMNSIKILSDSAVQEADRTERSPTNKAPSLLQTAEPELDLVDVQKPGIRNEERKKQIRIDESENGDDQDQVELVVEEEDGEVIQFASNDRDATKYSSNDAKNDRPRGFIRPMKSKSFVIPSATQVDETNNFSEPPITLIDLNWSMFEKNCQLGEGANGTVYKVKALKNSIFSVEHGGRIELNNPELLKKYGNQKKQRLGVNMHSAVEKSNKTRQLFAEQAYVIKEIDLVGLPAKEQFNAMQEVSIMAEIDSHFVVGYYDSWITERNSICICMEYCQHGDLCNAIKKQNGKSFANNFLWKVFIHICLGVHYLHARNVIHRDIKSLNVFLTQDNSAKLGDFGNIKKISSSGSGQTGTGQALERIGEEAVAEGIEEDDEEVEKVGTPYYLAPELWQNKHQTKASDIWALGVVLYEMCAQKYPYDASNIEELEEKVLTTKYKPIPQGVTKDFNMIIKQCLQKKPENRASIDEIIFSEDFQNKAKINKITLPVHLNKQKLLQKIQTKKQLEEDERRLIIDLQKRGVLKNLDLSPLLNDAADLKKHNSSQNTAAQKEMQNPESTEKPGISIVTDNLSQMSPAGVNMKQFPKSVRRKDSDASGKGVQGGLMGPPGSQTPFAGGHHGKHASLMQMQAVGGSQRRLEIGGVRHSAQPSDTPTMTHNPKAPVISVQRPRLHNVFTNNPMGNSAKDQPSSTTSKSGINTSTSGQQAASGQKKAFTFGMPGETRTTKLRAAAKAVREQHRANATAGKSHTDREAMPQSQPDGKTSVTSQFGSNHQRIGSEIPVSGLANRVVKREVVCNTEPNETIPGTDHPIFDEGTTFELTEGDSQPLIPGEKDDDEILDFAPVPDSQSPKKATVTGVVNRRKVLSQRWPNTDRPTIQPTLPQQHKEPVPVHKQQSGLKQPTLARNMTQRTLQLQSQPSSNLPTSAKEQAAAQGANNGRSSNLVEKRSMMKSPSAKQLGARSDLHTGAKVAQSQRTGIKVSTRIGGGARLTARPTVANNKSPVAGHHAAGGAQPQRTKFQYAKQSSAAMPTANGSTGKPPMIMKTSTAGLKGPGAIATGSRVQMDANEALRKPTGTAAYNRKNTPGKKLVSNAQGAAAQNSTAATNSTKTSNRQKQSSLMARARSTEAAKDRAAAQKRASAQQQKNLVAAQAIAKSTTNLLPASTAAGGARLQAANKNHKQASQQPASAIAVSKLPALSKHRSAKEPPPAQSTAQNNAAEGGDDYEEGSPRLMDLEEVGEEEDFEFPSMMPGQTPIQNFREIEQRMSERCSRDQQQMNNAAAPGQQAVYSDVTSNSEFSQSGEEQLTRHARHRYAYDSFLQPVSSTSLKDPSIVEDDEEPDAAGDHRQKMTNKMYNRLHHQVSADKPTLKRPGLSQRLQGEETKTYEQPQKVGKDQHQQLQSQQSEHSSTGLQFDFDDQEAYEQNDAGFSHHPSSNRARLKAAQKKLMNSDHNDGRQVAPRISADESTKSALLEQAIEAESALQVRNRQRIHSHFVDSKNEDMLLEDIRPDAQRSLGEMLLMDNEEHAEVEGDEEDLLI